MAPANLAFSRSLRYASDASFSFFPTCDPGRREVRTPRARLILLTDLLIFCEYMTDEDRAGRGGVGEGREFWLMYPPLAGRHLRVEPSRGGSDREGWRFEVVVMKKERVAVTVATRESREIWLRALNDAIDYGNGSTRAFLLDAVLCDSTTDQFVLRSHSSPWTAHPFARQLLGPPSPVADFPSRVAQRPLFPSSPSWRSARRSRVRPTTDDSATDPTAPDRPNGSLAAGPSARPRRPAFGTEPVRSSDQETVVLVVWRTWTAVAAAKAAAVWRNVARCDSLGRVVPTGALAFAAVLWLLSRVEQWPPRSPADPAARSWAARSRSVVELRPWPAPTGSRSAAQDSFVAFARRVVARFVGSQVRTAHPAGVAAQYGHLAFDGHPRGAL